MEYFAEINWIAVIAATVAAFMLGGLWFSVLFKDQWVTALKTGKDDTGQSTPLGSALALSFVTTFIMALALALLIAVMLPMSTMGAIRFGLVVGGGIVATGMASDFAYTGWSRTLFWIQASYHVAMVVLMSVIITEITNRF